MDAGVTEDKSMEIPVLPSPRANLQITTISLISSSCHRPIIEKPENLKGCLQGCDVSEALVSLKHIRASWGPTLPKCNLKD